MRILIVGSGGREHAIAWALSRSSSSTTLFTAPGNPGTSQLGTNLDIAATDIGSLLDAADQHKIDLVVVGPEQPLVQGIVDRFSEAGIPIVGPTAGAARLEGSKAFAKAFMQEYGIPTASHKTFTADEHDEALAFVAEQSFPLVIKASGLAAGKGAFICDTLSDAKETLHIIFEDRRFGDAGDKVVIEEYLEGEEASVFALSDGDHYVLLAPAQDHKAIGEGGTGPNTGGMGAYSPAPVMDGRLLDQVCREIIEPTLAGMQEKGHPYTGILYCGLMITDDGPKVIEYNCRLGDPEAQVVLPLLMNDAVEVFERLGRRDLEGMTLHMNAGAAACVVLASGGYPESYRTGFPIDGIADAESEDDVLVFHAGTTTDGERILTDGGRVLGVTAVRSNLKDALRSTYRAVESISFQGKYVRHDIGQKGLQHMADAPA